ncbi:hypothetical protein DPMN_016262 [Dreissena polymorpha]|uniref:Uncharacterized protein n=1 Tax=Dreissena polymorpha TaxID=45954 RepID=A0A9D4ND09_DREPO|nr:hypothetical protein DPMN_016262 [Dreissena polymorpha]
MLSKPAPLQLNNYLPRTIPTITTTTPPPSSPKYFSTFANITEKKNNMRKAKMLRHRETDQKEGH